MNKKKFVDGVIKRIVLSSMKEYEQLLEEFDINSMSDDYWIKAKKFYVDLDDEEKAVFLKVINQIHIDVLADIFALLDGVYWIEGQSKDLKLTCLENPEIVLNDDLTTIFLNEIANIENSS